VEYATLEWVGWFNNRRLLEPIANIPPAEAEANFYAALETELMAAQLRKSASGKPGAVQVAPTVSELRKCAVVPLCDNRSTHRSRQHRSGSSDEQSEMKRRLAQLPLKLDETIWGGSILFLLPTMIAIALFSLVIRTLVGAFGAQGDFQFMIQTSLTFLLVYPLLPAMSAALAVFVERMWSTFFVYKILRVSGRPIKERWTKYAYGENK
jgi:hypothetical protein